MRHRSAATALALALFAIPATQVSSMELGEFEYLNSCAQCHGVSGMGDGPVAQHLTQSPADLTVLTTDNGGVFPVKRMYDVIEGTADIGVHGREMPLWGNRYRERAALVEDLEADFPFDPAVHTEDYVRARILSVIEYLSTLQK